MKSATLFTKHDIVSFLLLFGLVVCSGFFVIEVDSNDISSVMAKQHATGKFDDGSKVSNNAKPAKQPSLATRFLQQPLLPNLIGDYSGAERRTTDAKEECPNNCFDQFCCESCQVINSGAEMMMGVNAYGSLMVQ